MKRILFLLGLSISLVAMDPEGRYGAIQPPTPQQMPNQQSRTLEHLRSYVTSDPFKEGCACGCCVGFCLGTVSVISLVGIISTLALESSTEHSHSN